MLRFDDLISISNRHHFNSYPVLFESRKKKLFCYNLERKSIAAQNDYSNHFHYPFSQPPNIESKFRICGPQFNFYFAVSTFNSGILKKHFLSLFRFLSERLSAVLFGLVVCREFHLNFILIILKCVRHSESTILWVCFLLCFFRVKERLFVFVRTFNSIMPACTVEMEVTTREKKN